MNNFLRYSAVFALTLAILASQGCMLDAVRLNRKAQIYIKHGQYDQATELLEKSLDVNFENSVSHYYLAKCYENKGDNETAMWEYELAVRFDPSYEPAQMAMIKGLYRAEKVEESLEATRLFLEHKDAMSSYFMRLENIFLEEQMERHAILAANIAIKAESANPLPFIAIAQYYYDNGNDKMGDDYLIKAFKVKPTWPGLARKLGRHGLKVEIPVRPAFLRSTSPAEKEISELEN